MKKNKTNPTDRWRGKRFICSVRQSDDSDGTTSTAAQLKWLHAEGLQRGMTHVEDIVLNGVTGSLPGKRQDLLDLIERKRTRDDFDVLMVQRLDRLTRGGTQHGFWFEYECQRVGIEILYAGEDLPEDSAYSDVIKSLKFSTAHDQARSISQRSVQGRMHALQTGSNTIVGQTPFGCDRLYLSSEDKPLFVIRNLGDGRQQKLHPETGDIIDTYGRVGGGNRGHYRKQKEEKPVIVPGAPARADVVREIFDLHYNQRLGGRRIASQLNERGVLSPTGKSWSQRQVESIYENPVYCGIALGNHVRQSIYHSRGTDRPEAVQHDPQVLATCQNAPRSLRPPDEWVWEDQPRMQDFLPASLRDKALTQIRQLLDERWQRSQDPAQPRRSTSKHKASEYVLTGLLFAQQDGADLTGVLSGNKGHQKRYYRHRRGRTGYRKGSVYNRLIPAQALEEGVFDLIRRVSADEPHLRQQVINAIESQTSHTPDAQALAALRREREAIAKKVQRIAETFNDEDLADAQPVLDRLRRQRRDVDQQIVEHEQASQYIDVDPEALAAHVIARLASVDKLLTDLTPTVQRELVEAFVERVEVDMATKDAVVSLRLPPWALKNGDLPMCLAPSSGSSTGHETHPPAPAASTAGPDLVIPLAFANCRYAHKRGSTTVPPCYHCRRRKAA